jgi:hypothetical protein
MKWGEKYDREYVHKLYRMVRRHCTHEFRFICLTDDPEGMEPPIEAFPIPAVPEVLEKRVSPWRKLGLFSPELSFIEGTVLFLDLDVVIVSNIDGLFDIEGDFFIIENWTQKGKGIGNSSVFRFERGRYDFIYDEAWKEGGSLIKRFRTDQAFVSHLVKDMNFWPRHWCRSFKLSLELLLRPQAARGCQDHRVPRLSRSAGRHGARAPPPEEVFPPLALDR